ncbi:amidase domain-containing protein [Geomicrobium sp. JSM 1781026]|uniref:amidase domain-containing protein n=1 Tax=Geomicrobium sp. JSM 1781026 TaxID=3344580 RepID=UPI0035C265F8
MEASIRDKLQEHVEKLSTAVLNRKRSPSLSMEDKGRYKRMNKGFRDRREQVIKTTSTLKPYSMLSYGSSTTVGYKLYQSHLIKAGDTYHLREEEENRQLTIIKQKIINDQKIKKTNETTMVRQRVERLPRRKSESLRNRTYNRMQAVQYAERWWNDYNPDYPEFTDNCTNFISQCLQAGGAPMHGQHQKEKGWWLASDRWSYSWAVAHSMRWYLSGSTTGLTAREADRAQDLRPGDVICYDFNGDGEWNHTAIVVAFNHEQEPLVNAQTANSRNRYWKYEDSTAWTPDIKYKFFKVNDHIST